MFPLQRKRYNRKSLRRTSEPATKVVSVTDLKTYLKIDGTDEDTILGYLIEAATDLAEVYTRRAFITQTYKLTLDGFCEGGCFEPSMSGVYNIPRSYTANAEYVELMRLPIQSITSITTYSLSNTSSVFASASYGLDTNGGRVYLNDGYTWPTDLRDKAAVEIVYISGYGSAASDVPDAIKTAVMMQAAAMYECRGTADLVAASKGLLDPFKLYDDLMA